DLLPSAFTYLHPVKRAEACDYDGTEEKAVVPKDNKGGNKDHHVAAHPERRPRCHVEVRCCEGEQSKDRESNCDVNAEHVVVEERGNDDERDSKTAQEKHGQVDHLLGLARCLHGRASGWRRQSLGLPIDVPCYFQREAPPASSIATNADAPAATRTMAFCT